ncbi:PREDICTED: kallikrein-4-like [Chinchilla lanigera]|uniref:kallikrein-4-like n=1 Tax=Chinchilla lanigera TaxID=34839 RepID=UPI000697EDE9|nr:PREDICTED: kallikrein-4-like [Chinchilla lanigera]
MALCPPTHCIHCVLFLPAEAEIPPNGTSNHIPGRLHLLRKRVTDGITCIPHSQPWIAALFDRLQHYCSGVLVHPQWVLSAAHCWRPTYTIGLGLHGIYDWFKEGSMIIKARYSVKHPQYTKVINGKDLMLIKLNRPVVESDTIRTIPIASQCPTPETSCQVSGWGQLLKGSYPLDLQCAIIPVVAEEDCRFKFHRYYHDSMFCAGGESRKNTCKLDSGGPLVCNGVLQGIVSGGTRRCGQPGSPGIYTNLCKFKEWINEIIQTR